MLLSGNKKQKTICRVLRILYNQSTVATWCKDGKIEGAVQYRNRGPWAIPQNAKCPKPLKKKRQYEMKKCSLLIAIMILLLLYACSNDATTPSATNISVTPKPTNKEYTEADAKSDFIQYLKSYSGTKELKENLLRYSPNGTVEIKSLTVTSIESVEKKLGGFYDITFCGSFYAYDKYGSLAGRCTFDAKGCVIPPSEYISSICSLYWNTIEVNH